MIKEAIGTGATVEEAKDAACRELGVDSLDDGVEFEIIEMQAKKVLGLFGGRPAKVRVFYEVEDVVEAPVETKSAVVEQKPQTAQKAEAPAEKKDGNIAAAAQAAEKYIKNIISCMDLKNITVSTTEKDNVITIDIEGEDVGFIIGRRGETLDALQYLACLAANRIDNAHRRVVINTGDYREKREKTLESLGRRLAIKAAKTGRKSSLEPMNPYERRIIHTAVQKINGATSWSEGENMNRHVVIGPDGKRSENRGGRGGRRGYNRRGGKPKQSAPTPNPDRKPLNEGEGVGLYGRIDK